MTAIAMMMGSVLGLLGAIFGWAVLDMSVLAAFGVYLGTSVGLAGMTIMSALARDEACDGGFIRTAQG